MGQDSTKAIYDQNARRWSRKEPVLLSDFTARPHVLKALGPLEDLRILDLGCGEGYVARLMAAAGAGYIFGVDQSEEMVALANEHAVKQQCKFDFVTADLVDFDAYPSAPFDRAVAVFLFNYVTRDQMTQMMRKVREKLAPGGRFVFTVPHPCLPFMRAKAEPFYFDPGTSNYFGGTDQTFEGEIWNRGEGPVPVRCVHKTFGDYFHSLRASGFSALPTVKELTVTPELLALDSEFFGPLEGAPLHVLFSVDV